MAENVSKNPAWDNAANVVDANATRSPEAALSSQPEVINFSRTGKDLYLKTLFKFLSS